MGGSSSSGLRRDASGREVPGPPHTATGIDSELVSTDVRPAGTATEFVPELVSTEAQPASNVELVSTDFDPAWSQNGPRMRLTHKSRQVVGHEAALGPEPILREEDVTLRDARPEDDVVEEDVPRVNVRSCEKKPCEMEVARHRVTHLPYRAWCEDCVKGRGLARPHRSGGGDSEGCRGVSKVGLDWAHFGTAKMSPC